MTKFTALRTIATLLRVLAWISLIGGILFAVALVVMGATQTSAMLLDRATSLLPFYAPRTSIAMSILGALVVAVASLVNFLVLSAYTEFIYLGLAIEHNTRQTAYYLQGENQVPPPPPVYEE